MAQGICAVAGCERPRYCREMCTMHYQRTRLNGSPGAAGRIGPRSHGQCSVDGCEKVERTRGWCSMHYARVLHKGDPGEARSRVIAPGEQCSVTGCVKLAVCLRMCPMHYQRQRTRGSVGEAERERLSHRGATCSLDGCGQPRRHREWCSAHYSQWRRRGEARPFAYKWADRSPCIICGRDDPERARGLRRFCSEACYAIWKVYGLDRPTEVPCCLCGSAIDVGGSKNGRRNMVNKRICRPCRVSYRKHALSPKELALRDGYACGICGELVDFAIRLPNRFSPSVDHVIPRARGGSDEPANLQLAHLICNARKSDRLTG